MSRRYPERPVAGVGVVVWRGDEVLLVRRGRPPRQGQWSLPGGAQDLGETVFEAARREVAEETGLGVEVRDVVAVVDSISRDDDGRVRYHYTLVDLLAEWRGGEAEARDDAAEVAWVRLDDLARFQLWSETERVIRRAAAMRRAGPPASHEWALSPREAAALQMRLAGEVVAEDRLGPVRHVAGVDAAHGRASGTMRGAAVLLTFPGLEGVDSCVVERPTPFPYVPGLLSFREAPAILDALEGLKVRPDLLLVDGQGIAHPRRLGIASHIGVLTGLPTIGVAKSVLVGSHEEPPAERGAWTPLVHKGEVVGAALRSRAGVRPVYVSLGHRVALETAIDLVLRCTPRYRLPEPIRAADRLAGA